MKRYRHAVDLNHGICQTSDLGSFQSLAGAITMPSTDDITQQVRKETRLFFFLIVVLFPLLSVAIVGGYGFFVWFLQMLLGPPGSPH
ncbi:nitrate reductase NapE component [Pseudomonas sp. 3296]|nr:nitrate reductase NapE component [Pseudomonas sp. 3296]